MQRTLSSLRTRLPTAAPRASRSGAGSPTSRTRISALAASAITFGAPPPRNRADVQRARTKQRVFRQWNAANRFQRVQQRLNRRFAQLGIRRVRQFPRATISNRSAPFEASASLFSVGSPLIRYANRAATRAATALPRCCAPLPPQKAGEIPRARSQQIFRRANHRRDDAFGIARAAAPDKCSASSREAKNGGTVSMCVESVTTGLPQLASTLNRPGSTSILSTAPPESAQRASTR